MNTSNINELIIGNLIPTVLLLEFLINKIANVKAFIKLDLPEAFAPYMAAVLSKSILLTDIILSKTFSHSFQYYIQNNTSLHML